MKKLILLILFALSGSFAQTLTDDFNRDSTNDLAGSLRWRRVLDLTDTGATLQINPDSTVSARNPIGLYSRGAVYWDSSFSGRFQVGLILSHKTGTIGSPNFYLQVMDDSSWYTGNGYGFRYQQNSGQDRMDIQRVTASGTDTPFVYLHATRNREFTEGDTLFFKFYPDGRKTGVVYGADGVRDSISIVDTVHNPAAWFVWLQGSVIPDPLR